MEDKIKILRIINRLNVGGPTYNVAYLSKYLPDYYHTKILSGMIESNEASSAYILDDLELEYSYLTSMFRSISITKDFLTFLEIIRIINTYKPDIVHTHAAKAGALGRAAAIFAKHRTNLILHTYHGNIFDGYFSKIKSFVFILIEKILARFTHAIVSISEKQRHELAFKYKIANQKKIYIIPLGFDLGKFANSTSDSGISVRREFHIPAEKKLVVITGRLTLIKNHIFLLEVIHYCKVQFNIEFCTMLVGDGELKESLKEHCRKLNLVYNSGETCNGDEHVIFASWRKDIDQINAAADICVLCSLNEGTPVSIIEAMASGKPVLTTRVGGVEDFITHGINGMTADLSVADFSNKLIKLIKDSELCDIIGKKARVSVLERFGYTRLVSDMDTLYKYLKLK